MKSDDVGGGTPLSADILNQLGVEASVELLHQLHNLNQLQGADRHTAQASTDATRLAGSMAHDALSLGFESMKGLIRMMSLYNRRTGDLLRAASTGDDPLQMPPLLREWVLADGKWCATFSIVNQRSVWLSVRFPRVVTLRSASGGWEGFAVLTFTPDGLELRPAWQEDKECDPEGAPMKAQVTVTLDPGCALSAGTYLGEFEVRTTAGQCMTLYVQLTVPDADG